MGKDSEASRTIIEDNNCLTFPKRSIYKKTHKNKTKQLPLGKLFRLDTVVTTHYFSVVN